MARHRTTLTRNRRTSQVYVHTEGTQLRVFLAGDYLEITDSLTEREMERLRKKYVKSAPSSKYTCGSCYGAGTSKLGKLCARCGGSGQIEKKGEHRVTERNESRLLRSLQRNGPLSDK